MAPGDYRRIPNWIGPPGCTVEDARFVPVGADDLADAMSDWENHREAPDRLVQLAILHAEFEALHPDGNGRRMLVPLFLWQQGFRPAFYAYFEANRDAYYEGLLAVSRDDDWTGWCRFFLDAVTIQAEDNLAKTRSILELYDDIKQRATAVLRTPFAFWTGYSDGQFSARRTSLPRRGFRRVQRVGYWTYFAKTASCTRQIRLAGGERRSLSSRDFLASWEAGIPTSDAQACLPFTFCRKWLPSVFDSHF